MRVLLSGIAVLLLTGCSSPYASETIDASQGGVPIILGGAGVVDESQRAIAGAEMWITLQFEFTNTSDRPQTVEDLRLSQLPDSRYGLALSSSTKKIGRMIDPGEDFDVEISLRANLEEVRGGGGAIPARIRALLRMGDGSTYLYPIEIQIPVAGAVPTR